MIGTTDFTKIVVGAISIIAGLVLLPIVAYFSARISTDIQHGTGDTAYNVSGSGNITGLTTIMPLIVYGFAFGLVGIGVGMIYLGFKGGK